MLTERGALSRIPRRPLRKAIPERCDRSWESIRCTACAHYSRKIPGTVVANHVLCFVCCSPHTTDRNVQAKMTAVTALFMVPTALVFPALLRKANTPPSSVTLSRPRWDQRHAGHEQSVRVQDGYSMRGRGRLGKEQSEEESETGPRRGERTERGYHYCVELV